MYPLDYATHLFSRQPELDGYLDIVQQSHRLELVMSNRLHPLPKKAEIRTGQNGGHTGTYKQALVRQ